MDRTDKTGVRVPPRGGIAGVQLLSREISDCLIGVQIDAGLTDLEKLDLLTGTRCLEELNENCAYSKRSTDRRTYQSTEKVQIKRICLKYLNLSK